MTPRVAIVGPAMPAQFAECFSGRDAASLAGIAGLGGTPVNSLIRALVNRGVRVDVITLDSSLTDVLVLESNDLSFYIGPYRATARSRAADLFRAERKAVADLLRMSRADVVHAHWTYEFAWPSVQSRRPHVVTAHDAPLTVLRHMPDAYRIVRASMAARVAYAAKAMTAVSPSLARSWKLQMPYRRSMAVVPNIVDAPKPEFASVREKTQILSVGNATALKNIRTLLSAFRVVRAQVPMASLVLVGPGLGTGDPLFDWAQQSGLGEGVDFRGALSHDMVLQLMATATLLCHPSREESFGMSVAEALSVGLPVVGGAHSGAIPWLLREGLAGVLANIERPGELALALTGLLGDAARQAALAAQGRERVEAFSARTVAEEYLGAYDQALAQQTPDDPFGSVM